MDVEIVTRPDAHVLGVMQRIDPQEGDYGDLWQKHYMPRHAEIEALSQERGHYGVYYATDQEGMADFVWGMTVGDVPEVPEGLTLRPIPSGRYAAFRCTMGTIGPTWGAIYGEWMPSSDHREVVSRPSIEYYPAERATTIRIAHRRQLGMPARRQLELPIDDN